MLEACNVRALTEDDLPMVLAWRNHPAIRSYMLTQHEISLQEHRKWYERVQHDKTRQQLIVRDGIEPIGFVQFKPVTPGALPIGAFTHDQMHPKAVAENSAKPLWNTPSRPWGCTKYVVKPLKAMWHPSPFIKNWALQKRAFCVNSNASARNTTRFIASAYWPKTGKPCNGQRT